MAINVLTPIETWYRGIKYRSRLEARWAVFFDKIRAPWEYEKEGYDLGVQANTMRPHREQGDDDFMEAVVKVGAEISPPLPQSNVVRTWYLPDFWMPQQNCFIEIKGAYPTLEEQCKAALLAQLSGKRTFIFGPLPTIATYGQIGSAEGEWDSLAFFPEGAGGAGYLWCLDLSSGLYCIKKSPTFDRGYNSATDELVYAYNAARSARF